MEKGIRQLQKRLGLTFNQPSLLEQALIHRSFQRDGVLSNERLEFLGDAILGLAIADHLYTRFPGKPEGELTKLKAVAVSEVTLAEAARRLGLGPFLLISKGEEQSGGRERVSILADALEAIFGAIYLDQGEEAARRAILTILGPSLQAIQARQDLGDYKTILQEITQEMEKVAPVYHVVGESGPDHDKTFVVEARLGDRIMGVGIGKSKKEAEQAAARQALQTRGTWERRR